MPVYVRPDQRNKDEQLHPFIVECEVSSCYHKVSHRGPEEAAWAALEIHQRSDQCPRDTLHFKQRK